MSVQADLPADRAAQALIRRVDDVEHPARGTWTASRRRTSSSFTTPRLLGGAESRPGRPAEATITVGEHIDDIAVTVRFDGRGRPTLIGTSGWPVTPPVPFDRAPRHSIRRWWLSGEFSVGGLNLPVEATLDYHGLCRHGDDTHGRFVLDGAIDDGLRGKGPVQFSIELLAAGRTHGTASEVQHDAASGDPELAPFAAAVAGQWAGVQHRPTSSSPPRDCRHAAIPAPARCSTVRRAARRARR
jgi:hypothetical protein